MTMGLDLQLQASRRTRALVVDDDPILRSLVRSRLAGIVDDCVEATDGHDAWQRLSSGRFDVALVDLSMPNLNGFALIQCMRGDARTRHMPIVVISSSDDTMSMERALAAGANAFLAKPVNWTSFAPYIAHLIGLSAAARSAAVRSARLDALLAQQTRMSEALASQARTHLRRIAAACASPERCAAEVSAAQKAADRLAAVAALLASRHIVDGESVRAAELLGAAHAASEGILAGRSLDLRLPDLDMVLISCSREAVIAALSGALALVAAHVPAGTTIDVAPSLAPDRFTLRIEPKAVAMSGPTPEDCGMDVAMAAKLARAATALDFALVRLLLEAHGGSLEVARTGSAPTALLVNLPADRIRLASMIGANETPTARPIQREATHLAV